jgi:hypothetical protein
MFLFTIFLGVVSYAVYKWFCSKVSYFDAKGIVNIKPTLTNQIFLKNESLPVQIDDLYKKLKSSK